jgi:prophage antirepressor-like protein
MQSTQVIPFRFESREVRTIVIDDQPWFCAADVCETLGYANSRQAIQKNCRPKGVSVRDTLTRGGKQALTFIAEGNLYRLIIKSRKEEAARFEAWVCDEVLPAIRKHGRYEDSHNRMVDLMNQTIGAAGLNTLGSLIKGKVCSLPAIHRRRATAKIWSQTHTAFSVRSAEEIPADQLDAARNFIAAYVIEGELLGKEALPLPRPLNIHYPIEALAARREEMLTIRNENAWLDVTLADLRDIPGERTPCEKILAELAKAGYEVEGAWWELRTYRNKMQDISGFSRNLARIIEDPHRYAVTADGKQAR